MTPSQVKTIQKVAHSLSSRFTFGYYDREDIEQEAFLIAVKAMPYFDPDKGSLENFLYTHINNRLKNFLRKHYYRKTFTCAICGGEDPTCESCERRRWRFAIKKHLMEPIDIENVNCNQEKNTYEYQNLHAQLELEEIFTLINKHLEIHLRADYLRMLEGLHVPKPKREIIENRIVDILGEYGYEKE